MVENAWNCWQRLGRGADIRERQHSVVLWSGLCGTFVDLQANEGARDEPLKVLLRWHKEAQLWAVYCCKKMQFFCRRFVLHLFFFVFFFTSLSPFSVFVCVFFFFLSLLQALVNTNSFCQGICGCVWIETETWEHWACLLLIEYAWLGLPGAVSDERRMKMLMFVELSWILKDLFNLLTYPATVHRRKNE